MFKMDKVIGLIVISMLFFLIGCTKGVVNEDVTPEPTSALNSTNNVTPVVEVSKVSSDAEQNEATPTIEENNISPSVEQYEESKFIYVSAGDEHSLLVKDDGTVWSFGNNEYGQLGDGANEDKTFPVQVVGLSDAVAVAGGYGHSLALKSDGSVWSWGVNGAGQLGDGTREDKNIPVQVKELTDIIKIATNSYSSMALKKDGTVWTWGDNTYGQLGTERDNGEPPQKIADLEDVVDISSGGWFSLVVKRDGTVWAWGWNRDVYLCVGTDYELISIPTKVLGISDVISVSASAGSIIALKKDATVCEWWDVEVPKQIEELKDIVFIHQSGANGLAIKKDGTLWAWGDNQKGQLGIGTKDIEDIPVSQVNDLTDIICVSGGEGHSIALKKDGSVWTWGWNEKGQLGDSGTTDRTIPSMITIN